MQCSRFICGFLLVTLSLATANCSRVSWYRVPIDMSPSTRLSQAERKIISAEESSALPKTFVQVLRHIEKDHIDEVDPTALMHGTIQGMLDVVASDGATVSPQVIEAMQSVTTEDPIKLRRVFLEALTHAQKINSQPLTYGAIHGLLKATDPEGFFIPPDTYRALTEKTPLQQGGTGIEISIRDNKFTITTPIDGGPAFYAGIQSGDQLVKVDGEPTKGMTLYKVISKLRGPEGSPVTLSILRQGFTDLMEFTLLRQIVRYQIVRWIKLQENIGYIKLSRFDQTTVKELERALKDLEKQFIKGLILDLRNNPGGLFEQTIAVTSVFLDEGQLITYTEARIPNQNMKYFSNGVGFHVGYPMAVIINAGSAAGSEIFAGALQDLQRAHIIGVPSYGRGTIQTQFPLSDGSALRLTTARFFTPKGRSIQDVGVTPDLVVHSPTSERSFGDLSTDIPLQRAVEILTDRKE
ncbi:MAG: S41 family peptidase [Candidatus Manganitrophus sp. SB1]|nr:S41 family peptidase [Candidatus Manganitrophus morganii]